MEKLEISTEMLSPVIQKGLELKAKAESMQITTAEEVMIANGTLKEVQSLEKEIEGKREEMKKPFLEMGRQIDTLAKQASFPVLEAKQIIKTKIVKYNEIQEQKRLEAERIERQRLEELRLKEEAERKAKAEAERKQREEEERKLAEQRKALEEAQAKAKAEQDETKRQLAEMEAKQLEEQKKIDEAKIRLEQEQRDLEAEKARIEADKKAEADRLALEEQKKKELESVVEVKGIRTIWDFEIVDDNKVAREFCSADAKKIRQAVKNGIRIIDGVRIFSRQDVR